MAGQEKNRAVGPVAPVVIQRRHFPIQRPFQLLADVMGQVVNIARMVGPGPIKLQLGHHDGMPATRQEQQGVGGFHRRRQGIARPGTILKLAIQKLTLFPDTNHALRNT